MKTTTAVIVAGGTGGHINAALAIGEALRQEGWSIRFFTGRRPLDYQLFKGQNVSHLDSKPLRTRNPFIFVKNLVLNFLSFLTVLASLIVRRPNVVIGAGGYVCGPTLLAAFFLFIPVFILEQNAVMGVTNRMLSWISSKIFVHFSTTLKLPRLLIKKVVVVGNPTRKEISPVKPREVTEELRVLVFGGSLGANQINQMIFNIIQDPPVKNLSIHHQVGMSNEVMNVPSVVNYVPLSYINDMQKEYEWCDVIISRAGASTISELRIIKKPVLFLPYPAATDNHQQFNAEIFKSESDFSVEIIDSKLTDQERLIRIKEFLTKASTGKLHYSKTHGKDNDTCKVILREIKQYARLV